MSDRKKTKWMIWALAFAGVFPGNAKGSTTEVFDGELFSVKMVFNNGFSRIKGVDFSASDEMGTVFWIPVSVLSAVRNPEFPESGITIECRDMNKVVYQLGYNAVQDWLTVDKIDTSGMVGHSWKLFREAPGKDLMISTQSGGKQPRGRKRHSSQ